jgi:hypothetical protein
MTNEDLKRQVEHIANELSGGVDGSEWAYEWHESNCRLYDADGEETLSEHLEWCDERPSVADWMEDVLDIEYIVNSRREYIGARVLVGFGGPNLWINTRTSTVEGYWWGAYEEQRYTDNLGLDDWLEEYWDLG